MKLPWPKLLIIANVVVLIALVLIGADAWVRLRVSQALGAYHSGVIAPMIRPAQPPAK